MSPQPVRRVSSRSRSVSPQPPAQKRAAPTSASPSPSRSHSGSPPPAKKASSGSASQSPNKNSDAEPVGKKKKKKKEKKHKKDKKHKKHKKHKKEKAAAITGDGQENQGPPEEDGESRKESESEIEDSLDDLEKHLREKALRSMRKAQMSPSQMS